MKNHVYLPFCSQKHMTLTRSPRFFFVVKLLKKLLPQRAESYTAIIESGDGEQFVLEMICIRTSYYEQPITCQYKSNVKNQTKHVIQDLAVAILQKTLSLHLSTWLLIATTFLQRKAFQARSLQEAYQQFCE